MSNDIEYYEFTYKIPKYKIKPPLNFCKYYQIHKDEIIIELQQENKQLKEKIDNVNKYIDDLLEQGKDKTILEAIKYMLGDKENEKDSNI